MPRDKNNLREAGTEDIVQEIDKIFQNDPGIKKEFDDKMNQIIINYFMKKMNGQEDQNQEEELENEIEMLKAAMFKSLRKKF